MLAVCLVSAVSNWRLTPDVDTKAEWRYTQGMRIVMEKVFFVKK